MAPAKDFESSLPPPPPTTSPPSFDPSTHSDSSSSPCPFCTISRTYAPYDPAAPPAPSSPSLDPEATSPAPAAFVVLSTPLLIAFLDILPLSQGHVLLCPRRHAPKLDSATAREAAALGAHLRLLSAALVRATGVRDWNVVQNNGAAAAQVVPHLHFHIIPRPDLTRARARRERFTSTMFGRGVREELDEDEAAVLAERIRGAVAEMVREEGEGEGDDGGKAKL